MKTERRHELQENELANWLGEKISKIRPYGKLMLGVLVLAAVGLLASGYLRSRSEQAKRAGWSAYFDAMTTSDPETFEEVAQAFPGTIAGGWSLQRAADLRLDESLRQMFQDRQVAQQELQAARELYEQVLASGDDPTLRQRATFGLAKCLESQGEFDQAETRYAEVTTSWPDSQLAEMARERLGQLKQPGTRQWYSWFAEQKPVASPLNDPGMFQDLPNLPDSPDLQMPAPGQMLGPGGASGATPESGAAVPPSDFHLGVGLPTETGASPDGPIKLDLGDETPATDEEPVQRLELDLPGDDANDPTPNLTPPAGKTDPPLELDLDLPANEPEAP